MFNYLREKAFLPFYVRVFLFKKKTHWISLSIIESGGKCIELFFIT